MVRKHSLECAEESSGAIAFDLLDNGALDIPTTLLVGSRALRASVGRRTTRILPVEGGVDASSATLEEQPAMRAASTAHSI